MSDADRTATTEAFALDLAAKLQARSGMPALVDDRPPPDEGERRAALVASCYSAAVTPTGFVVLEHWRWPSDPAGFLRGRTALPLSVAMGELSTGW